MAKASKNLMTDKDLVEELVETNEHANKLQREYDELREKHIYDSQLSSEHIKNLQNSVAEQSSTINVLNETIQQSSFEKKSILGHCSDLEARIVDLTTSKDIEILSLKNNWSLDRLRAEKSEREVKDLKQKLAQGLKGYTVLEKLLSIVRG